MKPEASKRKKRRDGEVTRERIIAAAIEILSEEGLGGVATGRLTKKAGIVQSGFYAHFGSVEECILVAAERIGQRLRGLIVLRMSEENTVEPGALAQFIEDMLARFEEEWTFVDLMLRYRRDPSPLGKVMSRFYEQVRGDVVNNLIEVSTELDIRNSERHLLIPGAHLIVMQFIATLEIIAEGLAPDRAELAGQLAAQIQLSAEQAYKTVSLQRI